ncbi:COG1835 Predicted acyltransferases [Candidatus Nanopelagicaceae bacterium]
MRIPQIQALRAFAAMLVVIYHAGITSGGYIGVDIFYVISGYLITGLLLRELDKTGTLGLRAFYLRRVKRLLPTSFFVLFITAITAWYLYPTSMRADLGKDIAAAGIYISNYLFAFWQMDYQNLSAIPPVVIHYWSLAVEEQFYLFWPFIILALYKKGGRRRVGQGVVAISIASFLFSLYQTSVEPIWAFYSLPTRAWELGVGALLLYIPARIKFSQNYLWIALALFIYGTFIFRDSTPFPGTAALVPVFATAISLAAVHSWPKIINRIGTHRVIQWLGEISYPLYLWHWPLLVIPAVYLGRGLHIYEKLICVLATLIFADLTHRFIEEPLRHAQLPAKTVIRGGVIATAISLSMGLAINSSHSDVVTLADGSKYSLAEIMKKPLVYDDGCHVNNGETSSPDCTYGLRGAKRKIVLFGDSHAAQWFPTLEKLANEKGFELISLTKSACPGPAVTKVDTGEYKNRDCFAWREYAFNRIKKINPDAVLVSGFQHFEVPSQYSSRESWWREGEVKTYKSLQGSSQHIIYISDTPHPNRDIPSCIAAGNLDRCNGSERSTPIFSPGYQKINPTSWLCDRNCPGVINGLVTYRDSSHLSVAMARALSPQLEAALTQLGVFSQPK